VLPEDLPVAEFAFPGPLRDQLVAAILAGTKSTTTGLVADYEHEGEPLPWPGLRQAVTDSSGNRVAVIETTAVRVIRLADVDLAHAVGEGEGYTSVAEWRAGHEQFWHSQEMREALRDLEFTAGDDTVVVAQTFRLVREVPRGITAKTPAHGSAWGPSDEGNVKMFASGHYGVAVRPASPALACHSRAAAVVS